MQAKLFVFISLQKNNSEMDLFYLLEKLNNRFIIKQINIHFTQKKQLVFALYNNVSFYVSFLQTHEELPDWYAMAVDAELKFDKSPVNLNSLKKRYVDIKKLSDLYEEIHFDIGLIIMEEMQKSDNAIIYAFQ